VDLAYLTVMRSMVLRLLWLALIVDLWVLQNMGPLSVPAVIILFIAALVTPFITRRLLALLPSLRREAG
jgi:hypothetical protein